MKLRRIDRELRYETTVLYRGRPLVVALRPMHLEIWLKGRRDRLSVPFDVIFETGGKLRYLAEKRVASQ